MEPDSFPAVLKEAVIEARTKRLKEIETPGSTFNPLGGMCDENALAVADNLFERMFEPHIVCGAFENSGKTPDTFERACEIGQQHYWVRVTVEGETWDVDINGEFPMDMRRIDEPIISRTCPHFYEEYHTLRYDERLTTEHLPKLEPNYSAYELEL